LNFKSKLPEVTEQPIPKKIHLPMQLEKEEDVLVITRTGMDSKENYLNGDSKENLEELLFGNQP
jgi:hypothetical protein